jgi:hypothetical protein
VTWLLHLLTAACLFEALRSAESAPWTACVLALLAIAASAAAGIRPRSDDPMRPPG